VGQQESAGMQAARIAGESSHDVAREYMRPCVFFWSLGEQPPPLALCHAVDQIPGDICVVTQAALLTACNQQNCIVVSAEDAHMPVADVLVRLRRMGVTAPILLWVHRTNGVAAVPVVELGVCFVAIGQLNAEQWLIALQSVLVYRDVLSSWWEEYQTLHRAWSKLTAKERQTIHLLTDGFSNKQIARRLGVTVRAVELRRAAIAKKLNVATFASLLQCALRFQWLAEIFGHGNGSTLFYTRR
jgi:FixJ family two-component response regulator